MTDWTEIVGSFDSLKTAALTNRVGKFVYLCLLKERENLKDENGDEDRYSPQFENLTQVLNPRKKDEEQYTFMAKIKNKETKKEEEKETKVKKFAVIGGDFKRALNFLLNVYFKEAHGCYTENDHKFDEDCITQLAEYSANSTSHSFANAVIRICGLVNVEKFVPDNFEELTDNLVKVAKPHFSHNNITPDVQILHIVKMFIAFVKTVSVLMSVAMWERRQSVNLASLCIILRQMSVMLSADGYAIENELLTTMSTWVEESAPKKEKAAEGDDADTSETKAAPKKAPKKAEGKGKKKDEPEPEEDEVDEAMDEDEDGEMDDE